MAHAGRQRRSRCSIVLAGASLVVLVSRWRIWHERAVAARRSTRAADLTDVPFTEFALADLGAGQAGAAGAASGGRRALERARCRSQPTAQAQRSLYHAWVTLRRRCSALRSARCSGIGLAVLIVHNDAADRSLMPWIIASQTVPILAIAPMVVVGASDARGHRSGAACPRR